MLPENTSGLVINGLAVKKLDAATTMSTNGGVYGCSGWRPYKSSPATTSSTLTGVATMASKCFLEIHADKPGKGALKKLPFHDGDGDLCPGAIKVNGRVPVRCWE